ncbi:MAG: 23S rRNA (adenine(2503)-C(2))-methyltransferase RlmN [Planctomycetia bacterium]|nr:23S rRNA (adenine(2503)-C(2))-methyltransferase RlmN [Planctomycetia bacterium]
MKPSLLSLEPAALTEWLRSHGVPGYRAAQIRRWMIRDAVTSFDAMTDLPISLRELLDTTFTLRTTRVLKTLGSAEPMENGDRTGGTGTQKLLLGLHDGEQIECVLLRDDRDHRTACVSSQVGCAMRCAFCATGIDGVVRNLSETEITEQLLRLAELLPGNGGRSEGAGGGTNGNGTHGHGERNEEKCEGGVCRYGGRGTVRPESFRRERLTHIVVMGMGEPLMNPDAVYASLERATESDGLNIGARHITISTVGIPSEIRRLADRGCRFHLAISLHAPDDALRDQLIPSNRRTGIDAILSAAWYFFGKTGRRVTFEYVLLGGVNDTSEHALRLAKLLRGRPALVNLIPYNPVPELPFRTPKSMNVHRFVETLESRGIEVSIRYRKGDDISAACGQLRRRPFSRRNSP